MKIEIRPQKIGEAARYYEILSNSNFEYFSVKPNSVEEEKRFLRLNRVNQEKKAEFNYSIFYNDLHVGAVGVRIHPVYSYIGEVGCFVDERYWNKGIASAAVKKIEEFIFDKLSIKRLEMIIATPNKASEKVALKNGYKREGTMRERLLIDANYFDCYLYAKIMK